MSNKISLLLLCALCTISLPTLASAGPSLGGLQLGDSDSVLKTLDLKLKSSGNDAPNGPATAYKYATSNGNDFSVTFKDGKAVWIENDWNHDPDNSTSLLNGFVFGKTTLADIDAMLGNNGYSYKSVVLHQIRDYTITFNCYGLKDDPDSSIIFITRVPVGIVKEDLKQYESGVFKLVSIVLAKNDYMKGLWGDARIYDDKYQDVAWDALVKTGDAAPARVHVVDIQISTVTTHEDRFSISTPVGFHRVQAPPGADGLYPFQDTADSHRALQIVVSGQGDKSTDVSGFLDAMLHIYSLKHANFTHTSPVHQSISGIDFICAYWSGTNTDLNIVFGGSMCTAEYDKRSILFSFLDFNSRYLDDRAIYQQSFESFRLE